LAIVGNAILKKNAISIKKLDVTIAKNYLNKNEVKPLSL
jgi:hypothetical protein